MRFKSRGRLIVLFTFLFITRFYAFEWEPSWKTDDADYHYIESIEDYNSEINWTTGKVTTEVTMSITYNDPNIGRQFTEYNATIREQLRENLLSALGYLRISELFYLNDYYSRQSDIRYDIVANVENAFYYPPIINLNQYYGMVELDIFGEDGMANLFYQDIDKTSVTKYINYLADEEDEYYDGLIIDTISFTDYNPSIEMRIVDEDGEVLYGPETVDDDYLEEYGVCEYTTKLSHAFSSDRIGENIYYVMPIDIEGSLNTKIVIANSDAEKLFSNPDTIEQLKQGKVVVVKPSVSEE